jgi:Predicted endonuclease distantly related to archaeal Holliday junction resolvase
MAEHNELGKMGEDIAAKYLFEKGYEIVTRNWHHGHEEIDIVAKDGDMLVIVEVKTRKTDEFGDPDLAVTKGKQRSVIRTADAYVIEHDLDVETRFDIVSVVMAQGKIEIEHIEDAFYPTL